MIEIFLITFFTTLIVIRSISYAFYYKRKKYGGNTITEKIRKRIGFDWHNLHFGIIILVIVTPLIIIYGLTLELLIFLAIGLSFIADQITTFVNKKDNYFDIKELMLSILLHGLIAFVVIIFTKFRIS